MNVNLQTETVKLYPRRIFKCVQENRVMERQYVSKDHKGNYRCGSCGSNVQDVTDTETGRDFMEILAI